MTVPTEKSRTSIAIDWTEFRQGWKVLTLAVIGICTSVGVAPLYAFGTLVLPLQEAFEWSRGEVQTAMSFQYASAIVGVQVAGWLNKRYGLRPVTIISLIILPISYFLITLNSGNIWQLYLGFVLMTFAGIGTLQVTWAQLICFWFDKNRGLALAIILCGSGLAAVILPSLVNWAVSLSDWRGGFWMLAALPLVVTLPLSIFWLSSTGPVAQSSGHNPADGHPDGGLPGVSLREAATSRRFWIATFGLVLTVVATVGMLTNAVPLMRDNGLSANDAAHVFGAFGVSLLFGRILVGYLVDRLWAPGVSFVALLLPAFGCLLYGLAETHIPTLILASALLGLGAGAEMDLASYLIARYFGLRDYSRIIGLHFSFSALGGCLAPVLFAILFEKTGSYSAMLTFCFVAFAVGSSLLLTLGHYPVFPTASSHPTAPADPASGSAVESSSKPVLLLATKSTNMNSRV